MNSTFPIELNLKHDAPEGVVPFYCQAMADGRVRVYTDYGESGWGNVEGRRPPVAALVNRQEVRIDIYMRPADGGWDLVKGRSVGGEPATRAAVRMIITAIQTAIPGWLEANPGAHAAAKRAAIEYQLERAYEGAAEAHARILRLEIELTAML